jgi:hypothetical protein
MPLKSGLPSAVRGICPAAPAVCDAPVCIVSSRTPATTTPPTAVLNRCFNAWRMGISFGYQLLTTDSRRGVYTGQQHTNAPVPALGTR